MHISEFDFDLPSELIAIEPLSKRDASRLLCIDRSAGTYVDSSFDDLHQWLNPSDVLVLNNTKVFPARLKGISETGGSAEIFLIREVADDTWEALAKPARRLPPGRTITFGEGFSGQIIERQGEGHVIVHLQGEGSITDAIERFGRTPLPPYIKRDNAEMDKDRERYQTIYARHRGAIAAPTAGLHFTPAVMERLRNQGVQVCEITLHVGYGTFEPVRTEDVTNHSVSAERFEIGAETAEILNAAKTRGRRIIAVGTTTTRTLEYALSKHEVFRPESGYADLTIRPGYRFRAIDGLLTNFHLPKSSLLVLVSTFAGRELIMNAYRHAVEERYRFYSYGDCMLIT